MSQINSLRQQARLHRRSSNIHGDITTFKILINSTLSTMDAEMMVMDIIKYYWGTPLPRYEYMRLPLSIIPDEIITK
jgi:hypothetical protein